MFINIIQTLSIIAATMGITSIICHTGIIITTLSNNNNKILTK